MAKIIIGIHGLGNKPPCDILKKWWKQSIREGLNAIGKPRLFIPFELVYWADVLYEKPLDPREKDPEHPLYMEEPYVPASSSGRKVPSELRKKILHYIEIQLDKILLNDDMTVNYSSVTDMIIHHYFRELEIYYSSPGQNGISQDRPAKEIIRERLAAILEKHRGKDILLISHSMGTIIAYDVMTRTEPDIEVDTFVTMGSPLGIPVVVSRIALERHGDIVQDRQVRTPENVTRCWYNFSDLEDKVAFNYDLGDDYGENSRHVRPVDTAVSNDYERNGKKNPHKIYGYLRTPELADVVSGFIDRGRSRLLIRANEYIGRLLSKLGRMIHIIQ
ncbi:hypothetical protein LLG96_01965 [bacterium]|nr:hypothetical protein [bacterium]